MDEEGGEGDEGRTMLGIYRASIERERKRGSEGGVLMVGREGERDGARRSPPASSFSG